jgi:hypothetical protein
MSKIRPRDPARRRARPTDWVRVAYSSHRIAGGHGSGTRCQMSDVRCQERRKGAAMTSAPRLCRISAVCPPTSEIWWRQTGSNRRPPACKAGALPTELCPRQRSEDTEQMSGAADVQAFRPAICPPTSEIWWAREDLNLRPHAYQARALTN